VASAAASETFRFKSPYKMTDYASSDYGLNWVDGDIEYKELHTVITGFVHLYTYGVSECPFLARLTGRPIHNPEDLDCHPSRVLQSQTLVYIAMT